MPRTEPTHPHVAKAEQYSADVLSGKIPACKFVKQALERQVRDLARQGTPGFPYRFDAEKAERACRFLELLPHVKGPLAKRGERWRMEPHQCWYYTALFGWVHVEGGHRRFSRAYRELPRGNGKSFEAAGVALYLGFADGEEGAEIYSAATTRDQAKIVWSSAKRMLEKDPAIAAKVGIQVNANDLYQPRSGSAFRPLSSDHDRQDGLNVYGAVVDELHAHPDRGMYDVLETAISKRDQSLLFLITTAGADRTGICYEIRTDLLRILDGTATDESMLGVIYTIDEGDRWQDEAAWIKANPNWGLSVNPSYIRTLAQKAERIPAAQSNFKTKHLNVWVGANAALFNVEDWIACGEPDLSIDEFAGWDCIGALDLATKDDIAEYLKLFVVRDEDGGPPHYVVFGSHYLPQEATEDGRNDRYPGWVQENRITATPGNTTDFDAIKEEILRDSSRFRLDPVAFDPWQATNLAQELTKQGAKMIEMRPTVGNFSEATKTLGALMKERRIHHDGDPVLTWMIGNVVGHYDAKENVYPRKERPENKIDGAVAIIMALAVALRQQDSMAISREIEEEGLMVLG